MELLEAYQGIQKDYSSLQINNNDKTPAVGIFTSSTVLDAAVWQGQNQTWLFGPTVAWTTGLPSPQTGYGQGLFSISFPGAPTSILDPAGEYYVLVGATTAGVRSAVWEGRLKILATPGFTSPSPPDLISYDYCAAQLTDANLSDAQRDNLPYLIAAASQAVRVYCFDRYFDLRAGIVDLLDVELDGTVRLQQVPIQQVTRVQGQPSLALTVTNSSQSVQTAQAYFAYTGTVGGYGPQARVVTGLTLSWVSNGAFSTQTLGFSGNETIATLAAAVNSVGSGWAATADQTLGLWPATELTGGGVAQGCALSSVPSNGALFSVLLDLAGCRLDNPNRGFLYVGPQAVNSTAQQWGPGGDELFGSSSDNRQQNGQVKVTYTAGFAVIPPDVQYWTGQLVKWKVEVAKQELLLASEKAADYEYRLANEMVAAMPPTVRQGLSPWRLHYA